MTEPPAATRNLLQTQTGVYSFEVHFRNEMNTIYKSYELNLFPGNSIKNWRLGAPIWRTVFQQWIKSGPGARVIKIQGMQSTCLS